VINNSVLKIIKNQTLEKNLAVHNLTEINREMAKIKITTMRIS